MSLEKRKKYLICTLIFLCIGFALCGGMAVNLRESLDIQRSAVSVLLSYGLRGGLAFGGLSSGIILCANYIKNQNLFFKICLIIFFPVTFVTICYIGILSFIPYEIYNFICLIKKKSVILL